MLVSGKWCPRREWSSPPDVARRVYSSVFLGSPGEYPGEYPFENIIFFIFASEKFAHRWRGVSLWPLDYFCHFISFIACVRTHLRTQLLYDTLSGIAVWLVYGRV